MNRDYIIIAIDFDGTLCSNEFPKIGVPHKNLINLLKTYKHDNPKTKFILWTCRKGKYLDDAILFSKEMGIEFDAVNENLPEIIEVMGGDTRKIFADYYIDDRNLSFEKFIKYGRLKDLKRGRKYA